MYFFIFIALLLLLLIVMLFYKSAVITFQFNTNSDELYLFINWFNMFKAKVQMSDSIPFLTVYLFGIKIYAKALKNQKSKKKLTLDNFRALAINGSYANIYYSFNDPFSTGITNGILKIIQLFSNDFTIRQFPDFIPFKEYVFIKAGTNLNIGKTIVKTIKLKNKRRNQYGSI